MINKMIENMPAKTGKSLDDWITILQKERKQDAKHKEQVTLLMERHGLGLNYADIVVHKANGTDSGSKDEAALIDKQYEGKESLRPIYDALMEKISAFASDVEIAPKNAYVSLRRKKQFACLKPATKTRFELELILKNHPGDGILEAITSAGAMCTHRIKLTNESEITPQILDWLRLAYEKAV